MTQADDLQRLVERGAVLGIPCPSCGHGLTTQHGASLQAKANSAMEWMARAAAAEIAVIEAMDALQKIATGRIDGEAGNARDTLTIVREIAVEAVSALRARITERTNHE